jgi:hypothetical protein
MEPHRVKESRHGIKEAAVAVEALVRKVNEVAQSVGILLASEICKGMERTH